MLKILPKEFMWRELGEVDGHTAHDPRFLLLGRMNADPVPAAAAMCNAMGQAIWLEPAAWAGRQATTVK